MDPQGWTYIVIGALLSLGVFLICREIVCWYFKMNEVTSLLREIRTSLHQIALSKKSEQRPPTA